MAIFHLNAKIVSRAKGQSVVACAAYRAGEKLHDERSDEVYDYTRKQDVAFSEVILPEKAPTWMSNREELWNAVEKAEKRKDAQLAREVQVALPRELTLAQNIELTREFVNHCFISKGMIADINIHMDKASDGELQPHAHILLTMREVLNDGFGQKVRQWNDKVELENSREQWANFINKHLALNGHDIQVDHRSFVDQGIDLQPQKKIGATSAFHRMAAYAEHNEIAERNGEKLLVHPEIALDVLTRHQSTFTHHDIARIVNRYTIDADQFQVVYEKVKSSPEIVSLGVDDRNRERFTTKGILQLEAEMVANAQSLSQQSNHSLKKIPDFTKQSLSAEQANVLNFVTSNGDLKCVVGYAGTGKSRLLGVAKEQWEASGYRVLGATLSGIAAEYLEGSSGIESRTIASRFYYWDRGQELLSSKDILVIDEAGMIGSRQMASILNEANQRGAKVVLVGDPEQLQAIEAGAAFRIILERNSYIELTEIWRQKENWQKEATVELATGRTDKALARYEERDYVHEYDSQSEAKQSLVDSWNDDRISKPEKTQIMMAYTRKEVYELNQIARSLKQSLGELGEDHLINTVRGERPFAEGERIYFLKNDRELGVKNGILGTILDITENGLKVELDKINGECGDIIHFSPDRYNDLDYGYAATIHKGQGVTVDQSYLLASKYLDRHAAYVALTRHSDSVELFWSREEFHQYKDLVNSLSRERAKDSTLDYSTLKEFVHHRGIELMGGYSAFESYPSESNSGYQPPKGFEDLFTRDQIEKINFANKNKDYEDTFVKSNDEKDFDLS